MGAAVLFLLWRPSPVLVFVLVIGGLEAVRRWRAHRAGEALKKIDPEAAQNRSVPVAI